MVSGVVDDEALGMLSNTEGGGKSAGRTSVLALGLARGRLRGQGVTVRAIVVLRDCWLQFRQIGAFVPVGVVASKKNQPVRGLVQGLV